MTSSQKRAATALQMACRGLQAATRRSHPDTAQALAHAELHALLTNLADIYLAPDQRQLVAHLLNLHKQCCYPLEYQGIEQEGATNGQ